jgi:hypothetical protein
MVVSRLTISVCIPCTFVHVRYLHTVLTSIEEQNLKPDEVIISISQIENKSPLHYDDYTFPVYVITTPERKYAGENRNIAALHSKCDLIAFIDADDIMVSTRLSITQYIFHEYPETVGLFHHFNENTCDDIIPDPCFDPLHLNPYMFSEQIHFGHPTFTREFILQHPYSSAPRGQDVDHTSSIVQEFRPRILVYCSPLSVYRSIYSTYW